MRKDKKISNDDYDKNMYLLVEYAGTRSFTVYTDKDGLAEDKVKTLLHKVENYNKRKTSKYLLGNIQIYQQENSCTLIGHLYRKYENRMKIEELDRLTSLYSEKELIEEYKDKSITKEDYMPDINVAYLRTKVEDEDGSIKYERGIRYLPVLYSEDKKYLDKSYIERCLWFHASTMDFDFFRELANEFCVHHFVGDEIEKLRIINDKCENQNYDLNALFVAAVKLYDKLICVPGSDEHLLRNNNGEYILSQRRLRDFGFFIKNYNIRDSKKKSPLCYNMPLPKPKYIEEDNGQLKLILK